MRACFIFMELLFSVSTTIYGQQTFSEEELTAVVKKFHPVAKQAVLDVRIAQANVIMSQAGFDPVFGANNNRKEFDGIAYYDQRMSQVTVPIWYGMDLFAGTENISGGRINPEETKGTLRYLGISMPLVQNLVMDKRRAAVRQAKIFREQSEVERKAMLNNLLVEALNAYWEWWKEYNIYKIVESSLSNAEKRFQMVKTTYQLGDRPAIDTLDALTQVQLFVLRKNESLTALIKAQLELSTFLWKEDEMPYELPMSATPQPLQKADNFLLDSLLNDSYAHPELRKYDYKLDALKIEKQLKFQSLLPKVDVKYNQTGHSFSKTINSAWFQNNYRFGISLYVPLRLSEGRGAYQGAKLKIRQTKLDQVNKQLQIQNKIKQYHTEWQQTKQQLNMQSALAGNYLALQKGEETKFFNGESSLFLINARELKTIESQQKIIELQAKNKRSMVQLKWAAGLLGNY